MVMEEKRLPSWLRGTLSKHEREAMEVLRDLLEAAYSKGRCTAEDVQHVPQERNVIGSVFKRLRSCGLVQSNERITPKDRQKHGRKLFVWEVENHARLERILSEIKNQNQRTLIREEPDQRQGQYLLSI